MKALLVPIFAGACLISAALPAHADSSCDPVIQSAPVPLSKRAIERGDTGTVLIRAEIDAAGRARTVTTARSSGTRRLDEAAQRAVRERWRFDVSQRAASALPAIKVVAVEFAKPAATAAAANCFASTSAATYDSTPTQACIAPAANATVARAAAR